MRVDQLNSEASSPTLQEKSWMLAPAKQYHSTLTSDSAQRQTPRPREENRKILFSIALVVSDLRSVLPPGMVSLSSTNFSTRCVMKAFNLDEIRRGLEEAMCIYSHSFIYYDSPPLGLQPYHSSIAPSFFSRSARVSHTPKSQPMAVPFFSLPRKETCLGHCQTFWQGFGSGGRFQCRMCPRLSFPLVTYAISPLLYLGFVWHSGSSLRIKRPSC